MDFKPIRREWRGVEYDSALEADWAATLTAWGIEHVYHPGRIFLSNNDIYEPDFQLEGDIIFEVKGDHDDRIDKAWRASIETGIPVIVGRTGWIPSGSQIEYAGAVWEPEEWVVVNESSKLRWTHVDFLDELTNAHFSAPYAFTRGLEGIRMFKAVGDDQIV